MRVGIELGKRNAIVSAIGWPGWTRIGKGEQGAIENLLAYAPRYEPILERAGIDFVEDLSQVEVVERVEGNATTDFGAPSKSFDWDAQPLEPGEGKWLASLTRAAWEYFDDVVAGAPEHLRKGPRGGGRDRDAVRAHVLAAEVEYGRKLGLERWKPETATVAEVLQHREEAIGRFDDATDGLPRGEQAWSVRYAARRGIWHVLDHAWEIEDKSE